MSVQLTQLSDVLQTIRHATDLYSTEAGRPLSDALSLFFEPSPTLTERILPSLIQYVRNAREDQLPKNYATLIDMTIKNVSELPVDQKAKFIGAHPRIGEVKGLSALSAAEQGQTSRPNAAATPSPAPVLERLAYLNAVYERRYPGLVYITFVNGRTRAQIRDELDGKLREESVALDTNEPDELEKIESHSVDDYAWRSELERAIRAIRDIAYSRLEKLGAA